MYIAPKEELVVLPGWYIGMSGTGFRYGILKNFIWAISGITGGYSIMFEPVVSILIVGKILFIACHISIVSVPAKQVKIRDVLALTSTELQ